MTEPLASELAHTVASPAPLIVHVIDQLEMGGLENGLLNLLNHMPPGRYRHAIVCLKNASAFADRLSAPGVEVICLHKREGKDPDHYLRLYRTLRRLQPSLVHTRNLACIEVQLLAAAAGVRLRVHGEHGRDIGDLDGKCRKHRCLRKLMRPLIQHFIAVSADLQRWLVEAIGAAPASVTLIGNGVDSVRFYPRAASTARMEADLPGLPDGFLRDGVFVIGSVGRMAEVKNYPALVQAFLLLLQRSDLHASLRLLLVGDGPARAQCLGLLQAAGVAHLAWLPGARDDVAQLMRAMDVFVLPSLAEGSSNTILEAMASGLPVVATRVGGNGELVQPGCNGTLVAPRAPAMLVDALSAYVRTPELGRRQGARGRQRVLAAHSLPAMAGAYLAVYDSLTGAPGLAADLHFHSPS